MVKKKADWTTIRFNRKLVAKVRKIAIKEGRTYEKQFERLVLEGLKHNNS